MLINMQLNVFLCENSGVYQPSVNPIMQNETRILRKKDTY